MKNVKFLLNGVFFIFLISIFAQKVEAQYFIDFEGPGETKTGYASGTVNLSGLDWNMTEALIGTLDADWKNGERSARLRGYGTSAMTMLQNKGNGIGNVSFYYRRYGTDSQVDWKVEYSVDDGSSWIQIGDNFTPLASNDVQEFNEDVNVAGDIRVRIKRATETGTSNKRLNIDDILITDYTGGTPVVVTPSFTPPGGNYLTPQTVTISTTTQGATIYYTTDGTEPNQSSILYAGPISVNQSVTIKARAYAPDHIPSSVGNAEYILPITVNNIQELRTSPYGFYFLQGEVLTTFTQSYRNQKFIQDATAGVLIDDPSGVIDTDYEIGDGITGIYGTTMEFGGMVEFVPYMDPGAPSSTGNEIIPIEISIDDMINNFETYESRVVKINNVSFDTPGVNFATGKAYSFTDSNSNTAQFRTTFYSANYIGTAIPSGSGDIIGILNSTSAGEFITSRSSDDLVFNPCFSIAQLRASALNQEYTINCEAILTYKQQWRNQKFVQDETAAILLDDLAGIITTEYNIGDGITGISGILRNHNGMLRLEVNADPGLPTSTNNVVDPEVVTLAQLNANFGLYQSKLVRINGVTFANGGSTFIEGNNYPISDASSDASGVFRTEFYDADYLYTQIPTAAVDLIVIPNTVSNANYVTSRFASDIISLQPTITVTSPNGYEMWERGTIQNITWTSQDFTGNVKIVLLRPPLYTVVIADNLENTGFFEWSIPADQQVANNYKIRVQGVIPGDPMDESNNFFSIVAELPVPKIVINEIMYNPPEAGNDTLEYIELYNADDIAHNLQGWKFSKGVDFIFPSVTINPGEYLVTAIKASAMMNTFGVTALQWSSGALSNSGEQIELLDNLGNVVDNVTYGTNSPWPAAANNHGPSLSLIDPLLDNSLAINWAPETALAGVNSAGKPIYGTPGSLNFPGTAQGIFIPKGWGGISSYITPAQPSMEDVMQLIVNDLTIVQNFNYLYFPLYQINSIGNWDNNVGYQLKIENARYHVLSGTNVSSKTVNLTGGWNGLPVLSQCEVNANLLFGSLPGVIFVKDMGSNEVYWPGGGLNTLEKLIPGRAYYIKVAGPISITFPECE